MLRAFELRHRLGRLARSCLAAWCAAACSTWSIPYAEPPAPSPGTDLPKARLNLRDGRSLVVYRVQVRSDSVVGMVWRHGYQPLSVSRQDVRGIQVPEIDNARTVVLLGVIVVGLYWTILTAIHGSLRT
jgi:hypothetical protein